MQFAKRKNLYLRDGVWYYLGYHGGVRIRKSTGCTSIEDAELWKARHYPAIKKTQRPNEPFKFTTKFISDMYYRMKTRFPGEDVMTRDELVTLIQRSCGICQVTGIPFLRYDSSHKGRKPFIPSIDRIDSKKPYVLSNCRIVCLAANIAMNEWGQDVFDAMAEARVKMISQAMQTAS